MKIVISTQAKFTALDKIKGHKQTIRQIEQRNERDGHPLDGGDKLKVKHLNTKIKLLQDKIHGR